MFIITFIPSLFYFSFYHKQRKRKRGRTDVYKDKGHKRVRRDERESYTYFAGDVIAHDGSRRPSVIHRSETAIL